MNLTLENPSRDMLIYLLIRVNKLYKSLKNLILKYKKGTVIKEFHPSSGPPIGTG